MSAPTSDWAAHASCNNAYKQVTCDRCGRTYQCTPSSDFYCTPDGDHCCESCLLAGRRIAFEAIGDGPDDPNLVVLELPL